MKASILIIDDSPYLHKLVRAVLYSEPVTIHSIDGGEEAVATAIALRPTLILLDVEMETMDGFEVCRQLKANPKTATIPIIFLTADITLSDTVKGLDLGATGYITKPFKAEDLRARVHAALRRRVEVQDAVMVDELTRLWNRRYLEMHLPGHLSLARRTGRLLTCVIGDIDGLEKINQTHGEAVGDEILRSAAEIFASHGPVHNTFCYLGGGKFVALLPTTNPAGAVQMADRARAEIEAKLKTLKGVELGVTCSFGVADTEADEGSELLNRADAAVERAKQSGRNQVSINRTAAELCDVR